MSEFVGQAYITERGVTYRQLDYWTVTGRIQADHRSPGSGGVRRWPIGEAEVAILMARLIRAGLTLDAAECAARGGSLGEGVEVVIREVS